MSQRYTENLEEIATYGLDQIDPDERVEVNLKDLLYVFSTLQEFQRFFHQPLHYQSIKDIQRFLGSATGQAGFKLLHTSIHEKMNGMIPDVIDKKYLDGDFECPKLPFYYGKSK